MSPQIGDSAGRDLSILGGCARRLPHSTQAVVLATPRALVSPCVPQFERDITDPTIADHKEATALTTASTKHRY